MGCSASIIADKSLQGFRKRESKLLEVGETAPEDPPLEKRRLTVDQVPGEVQTASGEISSEQRTCLRSERRRLTKLNVDLDKDSGEVQATNRDIAPRCKSPPYDEAPIDEVNRGLLAEVCGKKLLELMGEHTPKGGKKWSLGSLTDKKLNHCGSFTNKTIRHKGDKVDTNMEGIGYACKKGFKPESPNQDSWFILKVEDDFSIYAVMDGHGAKGHEISDFIKESMPKILIGDHRFKTNPAAALVDTFSKMQSMLDLTTRYEKIDASDSGSTVSVIVHSHPQNKLWVAHCGDSRCCLVKRNMAGSLVVELTRDHKPDDADERRRIESRGGQVVFDGHSNWRVFAPGKRYPGLNMSRTLGDLRGFKEAGISAEPEVMEVQLDSDAELLILASDGVWEFISCVEAYGLIYKFSSEMAMTAAEIIAREAWEAWRKNEGVVDDITCLVVYLNKMGDQKIEPPMESPPMMQDNQDEYNMLSVMPGAVPEPDWSVHNLGA